MNRKTVDTAIMQDFNGYLINCGKSEKTAYDYVKRIERICREYKISVNDLFAGMSGYSIDDLIGMYGEGGIKEEENSKKHGGPLSALKQFRDFMKAAAHNGVQPAP